MSSIPLARILPLVTLFLTICRAAQSASAFNPQLVLQTGHSRPVKGLALSEDEKFLVSGSSDQTVKIWDTNKGSLLRTLYGHIGGVLAIAVSPDGKWIASAGEDMTVRLWSVAPGGEQYVLTGHTVSVTALAFTSDNLHLISAANDGLIVWNCADRRQLKTRPNSKQDQMGRNFLSLNGKIAVVGGGIKSSTGDEYHPWSVIDTASGNKISSIPPIQRGPFGAVAISPDGGLIALCGDREQDHDRIRLFQTSTGKEIGSFILPAPLTFLSQPSLVFNSDATILAYEDIDATDLNAPRTSILLWNVATHQQIRHLEYLPEGEMIRGMLFDRSGNRLFVGSTIRILTWDVSTGKRLLSFGTTPKSAATTSSNDPLIQERIGEIKSGEPQAMQTVTTSHKLELQLQMYVGLLDLRPQLNFSPDGHWLVRESGGPLDIWDLKAGIHLPDSPQRPFLTSPMAFDSDASMFVSMSQETPLRVRDVRLFRNGSLVRVWHGDLVSDTSHGIDLESTVRLVSGENHFLVYAFNDANIKSEDQEVQITGAGIAERSGSAYVLSIGVSQYSNSDFNLKYAVADSNAFEDRVTQVLAKNRAFEKVIYESLQDGQATKAGILRSLATIAEKVKPEDAVLVFFAGHGVTDQSRFYLIPHDMQYSGKRSDLDEARVRQIFATGISGEELEQAFEGMDARNIVFVIDACNAGQILETAEKRRGLLNATGLAQLAYEKGMYILAAAQSYQAALETERLKHGYLTFALIEEGLASRAGDWSPKDGAIYLREWLDYAAFRVPQMQKANLYESRMLRQESSYQESDFQQPRVYYRREGDDHPFLIMKLTNPGP